MPCLADIGLLADDSASLTQRGTPGFLPPSWYLETSGQPDMWGLATTLYSLLTGNNPDKMGRPKFLWPPGGRESLAPADQREWQRLHAVIFRATHENPAERFRDFASFADAVRGAARGGKPGPDGKSRAWVLAAGVAVVVGIAGLFVGVCGFFALRGPVTAGGPPGPTATPPPISITDGQISTKRAAEFDNAAAAVIKRLRDFNAASPESPTDFHDRAQAVLDKMMSFGKAEEGISGMEASLRAAIAGINRDLATANAGQNGQSGPEGGEDATRSKKNAADLLEIRDELRSLAKNIPKSNLRDELQTANRYFSALLDEIYGQTVTADERFYFNTHIRPQLEREFGRIYNYRPGEIPYDPTALNFKMGLMNLSMAGADKAILQEIEAAIDQIEKGVNTDNRE